MFCNYAETLVVFRIEKLLKSHEHFYNAEVCFSWIKKKNSIPPYYIVGEKQYVIIKKE